MKIQNATLVKVMSLAAVLTLPGIAGDGKELFAANCQKCHGANGEGKPAMAKMLKVEMRHLGSKEVQAASDAAIAKIITEGKGKMKATTGVTAAQANDIVAFVRTLKQ